MMLMTTALLAQLLVRPWSQTNEPLDLRVAADFPSNKADVVHYAVPPMSARQRLPDVYPDDGTPGGTVQITMAKDEYEPGSFLLWSKKDLGKCTLEVSDFKQVERKGGGGERYTGVTLPKKNLDLKVVKVWYQNKNGWYSYFADSGFKLCPELLLNDEDLIRVDTKEVANYARLKFKDGTVKERWLNPPRQHDRLIWEFAYHGGNGFQSMRPEFCDAETLQPVTLSKNAFKQFFLTVRATKDTPAGTYRGEVEIKGGGGQWKVPVSVKVLDFVLPAPKAYFDENKDFYVASYEYNCHSMICELNGGDGELAYRQLKATLEDHVSHGQNFNWLRWGLNAESERYAKTMREAGMQTDVMIGSVSTRFDMPAAMRAYAEDEMAKMKRMLGAKTFYIAHGDEAGSPWLIEQRPIFEAYQNVGFKFIMAGAQNTFVHTGYVWDWHNAARAPEDPEQPRLWNQIPTKPTVAWYSNMHTGVENPEFNRRQNGFAPYLAGYSALCNYAHHFGPYNDDSDTYKPMVFAYGHYRGVIDTIQWEGFREGVDDIRYATLAVTLARKAAKSKDVKVRYAGNLAIQYLAQIDTTRADLDTCRLEVISRILRLKALGL